MRWFTGAVLVVASAAFARAGDDAPVPPVAQYEGKSAAGWTSDLASEDVKLRQKAAYALFKLGPDAKSAAAALVKAIRDADPYVRTTSAKAVEKLGADGARPVVAEIALLFSDERQEVRREAASLLWRLGPLAADVVPELTKALASEDEVMRANAAGCLANAGAAAKPALADVVKALDDPDENVRKWATKALVAIDPVAAFGSKRSEVRIAVFEKWSDPAQKGWSRPDVVALVLQGIDDRDETVRGWATGTLDTFAAFGGDSRPAEWIPVFRRVLQEERLPATRAAAAFGLGRYSGRAAEVVPSLLAAAKSREPEVKRGALLALAMLGADARSAVPTALDALRDDDPATRQSAAYVLGPLGDTGEPVIAALIESLRDESSSVRRVAVSSLAILGKGTARAAKALTVLLRDESCDSFVHESVAHALADVGVPDVAIPALTEAFEKDPAASPNVARSLVALDAPLASKALDRLIDRLGSPDDTLQVLGLLGQLGPRATSAVPAICKVLDGADRFLRIAAAQALAKLGPGAKDALPALERMTKDPDAVAVAAAKQAIEQIRAAPEPTK
jgi:HEAT repeat protein